MLSFSSFVAHLAGELDASLNYSERTLHVAERYAFAQHRAFASFMLGLHRNQQGEPGDGIEDMFATFEIVNSYAFYAGYPALALSAALLRAGRAADALALATKALNRLQHPESGLFAAELWRLRGEAAWHSARDRELAEQCLNRAATIASKQSASLFHQRASDSLALVQATR